MTQESELLKHFPMGEYFFFPIAELEKWLATVYRLSSPQGMGFLHYQDGLLPDDVKKECMQKFKNNSYIYNENKKTAHKIYNLDYLVGRSCKAKVIHFLNFDALAIDRKNWYDHTESQLIDLIFSLTAIEPIEVEK